MSVRKMSPGGEKSISEMEHWVTRTFKRWSEKEQFGH